MASALSLVGLGLLGSALAERFLRAGLTVRGFDVNAERGRWLAGQGGYGIMTSPAMGRIAAALAQGKPMPADIAARSITAADLAPQRFT